jgi:hypothetical protein
MHHVPNIPATSRIIVAFALLTLLGIWPALTNGQPFFYADTTAYVRGADLAISKLFGSRFSTDWAKDPRRAIDLASTSRSVVDEQKPGQRAILAGRSIVYGALLYLGEVFGGMWFSIILQSLISTYLVFIFVVRVLGLGFRQFLICCAVLSLVSPLPFFISYLMPDVFAGFLILGFAILASGWDCLSRYECATVSAVLLFSVLSHFSHLILLAALSVLAFGYLILAARPRRTSIGWLTAIATACVGIAVLWEVTFSLAVSLTLGGPAIRPPFVMAKLVSMLGEPAVAKVCEANNFVVCRFQERFPIDDKTFLWSIDDHAGVFNVVDVQTKRLLSDEQSRFALAIIPPNLGRFIAGVSLDSLRQLAHISLDEYAYTTVGLQFFKERMPNPDFDRMAESLAARTDLYVVFGRTILNVAAVIAAVVTALLLGAVFVWTGDNVSDINRERIWSAATRILLLGVVVNAIICGGFSDVNNRYEARVIWLVQLAVVTGICTTDPSRKIALFWKRRTSEYRPPYAGGRYQSNSELESR